MEEQKPKQIHKRYEPALKRRIIEDFLTGRYTLTELKVKYNLSNKVVIYQWIKKHREAQQELLSLSMSKPTAEPSKDSDNCSVQELQQQLTLARLKINTLETLIDVAEETFNIDIRKKSGAKPSSE